MKTVIFLPNWVGDAVMATPALRAVRRSTGGQLVGVMRPAVQATLEGLDLFDEVLLYQPRGKNSEQHTLPLLRRLRGTRCDAALLFTNSLRTGVLAWLSGARRRVGFARDGRGWLLTERIAPNRSRQPHPVIEEYNRLASAFGAKPRPGETTLGYDMELAVTLHDQQQWEQFWQTQRPGLRDRGVVLLNTGGAFGPAKNWPRESFANLARRIVEKLHRTVVVLCGPAEREEARWIAAAAAKPEVVSLADQPLGLGLTKAAIRNAELLITTDSGPRHFAKPWSVPSVVLYGPTHPDWSETYDAGALGIQLSMECGPCQQRECPLGHHRCMQGLSVDQVFRAVTQQLATKHAVRRAA